MSSADGSERLEHSAPRRTDSLVRLRHAAVDAARGVLPDDLLPDVALVVGELVDNAIRHGLGMSIGVTIATDDGCVEITVSNRRGRARPPPRSEWAIAEPTAPSGRGLGIVAAVAPEVSLRVTADTASVTAVWACADRADGNDPG